MDKKVLCVGLACLDMVQTVKKYPLEDSDQRCVAARWQRGGNASNDCTVLAQIGIPCEFMGTLAQDLTAKFMQEDFTAMNIDTSNCQIIPDVTSPISCVLLSEENGTRTIVHHPGTIPELSKDHFKNLDVKQFSWVHFEGRNVTILVDILNELKNICDRPPLSIELEKPRKELDQLLPLADFVFLSKDYAEFRGWSSGEEAVTAAVKETKTGATVVCAWGTQGAWAKQGQQGSVLHSPCYPPCQVVDTLGAGDTFVTGMVASQVIGMTLKQGLELACHLAGAKVGLDGFNGLSNEWKKISFGTEHFKINYI